MIDQEDSVRKSNKLNRLLNQAQFTVQASVENIQYDADRKLDRELLMKLSTGDYILNGRNIIFKGVSGAGKTWLATAFGVQACRQFYTVRYTRLPNLLEEFKIAKYQLCTSNLQNTAKVRRAGAFCPQYSDGVLLSSIRFI